MFQIQCLVLPCLHPHRESPWVKQVPHAHCGRSDMGVFWPVFPHSLFLGIIVDPRSWGGSSWVACVMSRTENLSEEVVGENAAGACLKAQGSMASPGSSSFGRAECEGRNQGHGREGVPTLGCSILRGSGRCAGFPGSPRSRAKIETKVSVFAAQG